MTNPNTSRPDSGRKSPGGAAGLLNQWGGKLSFFFVYTHFSHDLITGLLIGILPFIQQNLNLNYLQTGFLLSAFTLTAGFSQFFGGWVSDRIGPRRAVALGVGGVGLSAVAIGFTGTYYLLIVALIVMGLFAGFYHPSAVSTLTNNFEEKRRGKVVSLHMVGGSLGFGIGPFVGAIIASRFNWHISYLLLGLFTVMAVPLALVELKNALPAKPQSAVSKIQSPTRRPGDVWKSFKKVLWIYLISTAVQVITIPIMSFMPLFLVDVHHLSEETSSIFVTVIRLGGLLGSFLGGWLLDRWGRRKTIFLNLILFGPIVYLLSSLHFGGSLVLIFILFGLLLSMREATMQTYLMDNTLPYLRGTVFGVYFGIRQLDESISQTVAGDFMDSLGITGVFNILAYATIGLSALAIITAFRYSRLNKN